MKKHLCTWVLALAAVTPAAMAQQPATNTIGHLQNLSGSATVDRAGTPLPAAAGMVLLQGDRIRTGRPGAAGIVLTDDTSISLGSGSELLLNDYAFAPQEGKFALALKLLKGTFSYVTGQIVKLAPEAAHVQTPTATIAVRGTKLLIEVQE
ncbi:MULTISPECIES: FecR family protein [Giesbergeria]|uniref:FecR domain-containing protein n=1 Tax=Giesbergeria sinuosa TaxID=80883 RepID=A0ABV9Q9D5_9BURK